LEEDNVFDYKVTWQDLDPVGQIRGSVYIDLAIDAQFTALDRVGYSTAELIDLGYAPIVLRQESRFYNPVGFGDSITDTTFLSGLSPDGSRWIVQHDFARSDGMKAAMIKIEGTWINLKTRDMTVPPKDLLSAFDQFQRHSNFQNLRSLIRKNSQ
jgi:acyl-CoA thioester hydrolase